MPFSVEEFLEGVDLLVARLDLVLGRELAHAADQHVLVMRTVEDADEAAARGGDDARARGNRARSSSSLGARKAVTVTPSGPVSLNTCLMVPSLPAVSVPCSTTSSARLPSA